MTATLQLYTHLSSRGYDDYTRVCRSPDTLIEAIRAELASVVRDPGARCLGHWHQRDQLGAAAGDHGRSPLDS